MDTNTATAAADALQALLTGCERIQSEQPARRFLSPAAAATVREIIAALRAEAQPAGIDTPATPESAARLELIGEAVAREFRLPRIRRGPDAGRYRLASFGTKTPQGLGAVVSRLVSDPTSV